MLKISPLRRLRLRFLIWRRRHNDLQRRFIIRVLAPPFIILVLLSITGLWQMGRFIKNQAISELNRSATSTAAKLEREFAIRQTVLKRTGDDLFKIKEDYRSSVLELNKNRDACSSYVKQSKSFLNAPNGVCDPFLQDFAVRGVSLQAIEDRYVAAGNQLAKTKEQKIQDRLSAYNLFFPETRILIVSDANQQLVSSATSSTLKTSTDNFLSYIRDTTRQSIEGEMVTINGQRLAVFAYPITNGSVLAAYDLDSASFIKQTWDSTPIDRSKSFVIILDAFSQIAYPNAKLDTSFNNFSASTSKHTYSDIRIKGVPHVAVGATAGSSKWLVAVVSPQAFVFGPLHDAQLEAAVVIGLLLVGLLWVGAIFIRRSVKNIMQLVSGALLFASGKLNYIIQLPKADQEFVQLAETLNTMAWRIADAEKELDKKNKEFISIATHELRTPLTAILGNLSMAVEDYGETLDKPVKSIIEQAHTGTLRLRDLVNDMLDMARLEGGRVEFVIAEQDIKKIIQETVDTLKVTASEQDITLKYKPAHVVTVLADISKLRIVLNNFISNAIKYNRTHGTVEISHELKDGELITAVADSGLGIPSEQKAHIFEKFFRVNDADRQKVTGTGLGMYITRRYVMAMGGRVWFQSEHGKGTTFYFSLPLANKSKTAVEPTT